MRQLPGITLRVSIHDNLPTIDWTHVANYPVERISLAAGYAIVEGLVYNRDVTQLQEELNQLNTHPERKAIERVVSEWDGDFVVVLVRTDTNSCIVFNDFLGRLPLYLHRDDNEVMVSRKFSSFSAHDLTVDRISQAFQLLFGYAVGNRTIWKEVTKIPGNTILRFSPDSLDFCVIETNEQVYFPVEKDSAIDTHELLASLKQALLDRLHHVPNLALSLSGGLDSRLLAGILATGNTQLPAITYNATAGHAQDCISAAELIARIGWTDHRLIELGTCKQEDVEELFLLKGGQNFLAMSFILPYLHYFEEHGLCMITGDGGDKTIERIHPMRRLRDAADLWNYVVVKNAIASFEVIFELTGVGQAELKTHFLAMIDAYPEHSLEDKYARFILTERGLNWLFEGEDRNRLVTWSVTPFYSNRFFWAAMRLAPDAKKEGNLFRLLLRELPGGLGEIVNPNWMVPLNDEKGVRKLMRRQRLKTWLPDFVRERLVNKAPKITYAQWLKQHGLRVAQHASCVCGEQLQLTNAAWWLVYTQIRQLNTTR